MFNLVGITDPTVQTGISAGLSIFTWLCQIAAVVTGRKVGRKPILLWTWPIMLLCLIGLCVAGWVWCGSADSSGVFAQGDEDSSRAGVATCVERYRAEAGSCLCGSTLEPLTLPVGPGKSASHTDPVLYSYPAEVQTYSMRTKGLLVWNTVSQLESAYVTWVDAIALNSIGEHHEMSLS